MIKFTLKCENGHQFDSWFQSASAFEKLNSAGMLTCETCGTTMVEKAIMAPAVRPGRNLTVPDRAAQDQTERTPVERDRAHPLSQPQNDAEKALAAMRREIEEKSEYVGGGFASEARDMHEGLVPARPIHGEAKPDEARKLIEDGVPVAPLPFIPNRKAN
ncbi:MAG: DUF1178 family protein [Pseudomonadota bacterium]